MSVASADYFLHTTIQTGTQTDRQTDRREIINVSNISGLLLVAPSLI